MDPRIGGDAGQSVFPTGRRHVDQQPVPSYSIQFTTFPEGLPFPTLAPISQEIVGR